MDGLALASLTWIVMTRACPICQSPLATESADFVDLCGPVVTVTGVPALACRPCGFSMVPADVLYRLAVILEKALDQASDGPRRQIDWAFTASGPPEVGGFPPDVRGAFARLAELIARERAVAEAARRVAASAQIH